MNYRGKPLPKALSLIAISLVFGVVVANASAPPGGLVPFVVAGVSMEPTLHSGQIVELDIDAYRHAAVKRRDLVVFRLTAAGHPEFRRISRVIALPGERVSVKRGKGVFINGKPLFEPYARRRPNYVFAARTVPPRRYFVLGDNRSSSYDSSKWPTHWLRRKDIIGKVELPPNPDKPAAEE